MGRHKLNPDDRLSAVAWKATKELGMTYGKYMQLYGTADIDKIMVEFADYIRRQKAIAKRESENHGLSRISKNKNRSRSYKRV